MKNDVRGDRNRQLKEIKTQNFPKNHTKEKFFLFSPFTVNHLTFDRNGVWQVEGLSICFLLYPRAILWTTRKLCIDSCLV